MFRSVAENGGVVAKGHDAGIGKFDREEVLEPEGRVACFCCVCPGSEVVAVEAVDGDDADDNNILAESPVEEVGVQCLTQWGHWYP